MNELPNMKQIMHHFSDKEAITLRDTAFSHDGHEACVPKVV